MTLVARSERADELADLVAGTGIQGLKGCPPGPGQRQRLAPGVVLRGAPLEPPALLETPEDAAQVSRIQA